MKGVQLLNGPDQVTYFLHTCTPTQIKSVVRFIKDKSGAKLIIMLRYSITVSPANPDQDHLKPLVVPRGTWMARQLAQ
jgi:hypothetical protein